MEDNNEVEDNNKDDNNDMGISALGLDGDLQSNTLLYLPVKQYLITLFC